MKKLFLCTLCLLMLVSLTGCRRKTNQDVPAPDQNQSGGNVNNGTDGNLNGGTGNSQNSGTTNDFTTPDTPSTPGQAAQDVVDGTKKAVRELWDDMKITAANLTDLEMTDADALLEEWGLDKTLLEDYTVKRYSDGEGGRMILARVKTGQAAQVAAALQAKGVDAKVWENGDYVLIADTDRAQDIVTRFQAITFN